MYICYLVVQTGTAKHNFGCGTYLGKRPTPLKIWKLLFLEMQLNVLKYYCWGKTSQAHKLHLELPG